jgi:hypothetical protein
MAEAPGAEVMQPVRTDVMELMLMLLTKPHARASKGTGEQDGRNLHKNLIRAIPLSRQNGCWLLPLIAWRFSISSTVLR